MPPKISDILCTYCDVCVEVCPEDVLKLSMQEDEVPEVVYPEECWECGICMIDCPEKAIKMVLPLAMRPIFVRVKEQVVV